MHILLVEDHKPTAKVEAAMLKELGHDCDIAIDGAEALEKYKNSPYALIIMDLQLPDIDGLETTKRIRRFEEKNNRPPTPIIGVTGHATEDDRLLSEKAGMDGHLAKPFRMDDLEKKIGEYEKSTRRQENKFL